MRVARRWVELSRRWAVAVPESALGVSVVAALRPGATRVAPVLLAFGLYMTAALVMFALAVLVGGVVWRAQPGPARHPAESRRVLLHAALLAAITAASALFARPLTALVPIQLGFRPAIASVIALHAGVGLGAALGAAAFARGAPGQAYPSWLVALAHLAVRALTASDLALFAQGRETLIDVLSLCFVFACFAAAPRRASTAWLRRGMLAAGCAAALATLLVLNASAGQRAALAASQPGATGIATWLRGRFDLDGDGFASVLGGNDCDDSDPSIQPAGLERVGNGIDDNCSGGDLRQYVPPPPPRLRANGPRRNLLLITVDAMRADVSGPDQTPPYPMPQLRAFAAHAAVFARTYVQAPYTSDSLQSLITGHYPMNMTAGGHWLGSEPDMPKLLRGAGYATQALHSLWLRDPNTKQVAETSTFLFDFEAVDRTLAERNRDPLATTSADITERALMHLAELRAQGRPFFLWVHYFDMHAGYAPRSGTPFSDRTVRERYLQEAYATDADLGRLLRALEASGFYDNGIVAVTGDHGEMLGEHGHYQHALFMDEACLRTTLFLRGPGLPAGRYDTRVRLIDVAPTLLDLASGIEVTADGRSLVPVMSGGERADRDVFVRSIYAGRMYRRAALIGPWKLVQDVVANTFNLYRVDRDPGEQDDLAAAQPALRDRMLWQLGHVFDLAMNDRVLSSRAGTRLPTGPRGH